MELTYGFPAVAGSGVGEVPRRRQKFLLAERLQATALEVLKRLVEATYYV